MTAPTPTPSDTDTMAVIRAAAEGAEISISRSHGQRWGVALQPAAPGAHRFWGTSFELPEALAQCLAEAAKRGLVVKTTAARPITPDDRLARRLARALLDVLDGIQDHHIEEQTSASAAEAPGVIEARREAQALLGLEQRGW